MPAAGPGLALPALTRGARRLGAGPQAAATPPRITCRLILLGGHQQQQQQQQQAKQHVLPERRWSRTRRSANAAAATPLERIARRDETRRVSSLESGAHDAQRTVAPRRRSMTIGTRLSSKLRPSLCAASARSVASNRIVEFRVADHEMEVRTPAVDEAVASQLVVLHHLRRCAAELQVEIKETSSKRHAWRMHAYAHIRVDMHVRVRLHTSSETCQGIPRAYIHAGIPTIMYTCVCSCMYIDICRHAHM